MRARARLCNGLGGLTVVRDVSPPRLARSSIANSCGGANWTAFVAALGCNSRKIGVCVLLAGCNGGNGLTQLPPVTPVQAGVVGSHVAATAYFVELHPLDAPDLPTLRKIHDEWHAGGIRIDYIPGHDAFYDKLVSDTRSAGLTLSLTTPYTSARSDVSAYVQAVGLAVRRYAGNGIIWEVYNEPDLLYGEDVNVGVANYVALAKPTALAIRANDATALILSGGTSGRDEGFPFAIAAGKALAPYVDGISIHPYGIDYNSMGSAVVKVSLATGKTVYITEWATYGGQGLGQAMASAKGLTPIFCVYEYQEQASEKAAHDVVWGLVDTGAWVAFAAAAKP